MFVENTLCIIMQVSLKTYRRINVFVNESLMNLKTNSYCLAENASGYSVHKSVMYYFLLIECQT